MDSFMKLDFYSEFKNYAINHMGISGMQLHYWEKLQERIYGATSSLTPYILEEREMRVTQMDIFSRLMMDRILWVAGPVNDAMSTVVQAQLMFLDNVGSELITMHIDTPGGSTKSGKSIIDVMNYISSDIQTINTGMAASMGSVLLVSGAKGKRYSLPSSKVMIHQVSYGSQGVLADMRISITEAEKENESLFKILGEGTNKDPKQVMEDANRDLWFSAKEALDYGIIDGIISHKN
jgi:ATP-dependent Clp protease protease subunit